jgi:hypothetical protein
VVVVQSPIENLPGMAEGKYFSTSLTGAQQYASMAEKAQQFPTIPKNVE